MRWNWPHLGAFLLVLVAPTWAACGDHTGFTGSAKTAASPAPAPAPATPPEQPPAADANPATPAPLASLTWFWQCDSTPVTAPVAASPKDPVIVGGGSHQFAPDDLKGTPISFSGHICPPAQLPRDVVLIIDTSGSMQQNDPRTGDSCGRLAAVEAVIAAIPAGSANFSIVTFNSDLDKTSTAMFPTQDKLFADIDAGGNIADVLCAFGGSTNYQAGLTKAATILAGGRPKATKEIYFVSDGQPDAGSEGIAEATALKTTGVTVGTDQIKVVIATVMLNGSDQILEKLIASKDSTGKALHAYVADTNGLAKALTDLAANGITGGDIKYRAIGTTAYTTLSLMNNLQGFDFKLPSITINTDQAPNGVEVLFEYVDQHDNRYSTGGKLLWAAAGSGG